MTFISVSKTMFIGVVLAVVSACRGQIAQGGSETNWICASDADCPTTRSCVAKKCAPTIVLDNDAGAAGNAGTGGNVGGGGSAATAGSNAGAGGGAGGVTQTATTFTDVVTTACGEMDAGGQCLTGRCIPALDREASGAPSCTVMDASTGTFSCVSQPGFAAPGEMLTPTLNLLRRFGICDAIGAPRCLDMTVCARVELSGSELQNCLQASVLAAGTGGWCYVDAASNRTLADQCSANEPGLIRVAPMPGTPHPHSIVISCTASGAVTAPVTSTPGKIGDPCIPSDEYRSDLAGFAAGEVNVETGTSACETGTCLAANFNGRVSCPYGQPAIAGTVEVDPAQQTCRTPDGAPVTVPVPPQFRNRRPAQAVYCSCRCDGADKTASYCACPAGFDCAPLIDDFGFGNASGAGSYCVKSGTEFDASADESPCNAQTLDCGPLSP